MLARLVITVGGLELLFGIALIMHAGALLATDRPALGTRVENAGQPARSQTTVLDGRWREARRVAEGIVALPSIDLPEIERIEARPPLGDLGLAVPPKTPMPDDWRETLLFRPMATSSATFESMGRKVAVSGVASIEPEATCSFHDVAWSCGQRARAAFNSWLRGRALKCFMPPEIERFAIAAPCSLGKQDVGAWLVSNGWAIALPTGIYGKAQAVAEDAEVGVFGPPR
ncbi:MULTISPECIES: thermonuclease family protein [unclassified Mesorhizobium]|uniref:thermonuclease family protein n=1 Tax=unclassified Mesorhizobium TaxID=325217 RepID=UPI00112AC5B8|nr:MULTISPECIES: thermonuclease family protein [unclassified Mesorhizobium]MCA0055407.1 thermonuclease family protein [Mesorhizobium sp. B261B1A]TPJ60340.1 thermonuclease family protein [Mesorhizobium sp. B2-6-1]TPK60676.1 thermonuclease family protein [Mesorhizobium sp. B2-5-1]TPL14518.1 thermonuclease family protein [Mesorhizobium sp. B2-4-11]TPM07561.1 thermonuclease family protein [Mesorhizobium sp. B2-3-8]